MATDLKNENTVETNGVKIEEVKPKKKKFNKKFILFYLAGIAFLIYASFTIINQSIEIKQKREELGEIQEELEIVEMDIDELKSVDKLTGKEKDEYMENKARDYDYVKNGERVFVTISGD